MKRPGLLLWLVLGILVSGCAKTVWTKSGLTEAEYRADAYTCERDMRQSGHFGTGLVGALEARGFYERCMVSKGYRKMTEEELNRPGGPNLEVAHRPTKRCGCGK